LGRIKSSLLIGVAALAASVLVSGCSSEEAINETVATINGNRVSVMEVREASGIPGGLVSASMLDKDQKKKVIDQIAETRILAQEARTMGLDNSPEFKEAVQVGEAGIVIKGLFRKELDAKGKKIESEIETAAKALTAKDKNLKPADARFRAGQTVFGEKLNLVQKEVTEAANKAFPQKVDGAVLNKIAAGEKVSDDTVVGTAGTEKLTYGQTKALMEKATQGMKHAGKDFSKDPKALASVIGQDLANRSLLAYAKQQGGDKGRWHELDRSLLENSVLIGILAEKVIFKDVSVSDKEIESAYGEHKDMFMKDGKLLPLAEVRPQIANFLQNDKKRKAVEAFLAPLKAKAKITITESMLSKI
jgi:hypothetical protein